MLVFTLLFGHSRDAFRAPRDAPPTNPTKKAVIGLISLLHKDRAPTRGSASTEVLVGLNDDDGVARIDLLPPEYLERRYPAFTIFNVPKVD